MNYLTYTCVVLNLLNLSISTIPHLDGRIIGGEEANITDFPYQVSLRCLGAHKCGASIFHPSYVLTAAHCVEKGLAISYSIRAGSNFVSKGGTVINVCKVEIHENYTAETMVNDIAVLTLCSPITFSDSILPVTLASVTATPVIGKRGLVTGWGFTEEDGSITSSLKKVSVPIITNSRCQALYPDEKVTDDMICAGYIGTGGKDACQGDSGGPLRANGQLYGIVSWGYGCARPWFPGVYTNVAKYRNWIRSYKKIDINKGRFELFEREYKSEEGNEEILKQKILGYDPSSLPLTKQELKELHSSAIDGVMHTCDAPRKNFQKIFDCGSSTPLNFSEYHLGVVGGQNAWIEDYPYQVSILYQGSHGCGGSIIDENHILTAAHCTYNVEETILSVRVGSSWRNEGGAVYDVEKIEVHPDFDDLTFDYDISILRLTTSLDFGKRVQPITLATAGTQIDDNLDGYVTGWGKLGEQEPMSNQLQVVELPVISTQTCSRYYPTGFITERMFCAGYIGGGKDTCDGDSGGPIVVAGIQIGIVSWGIICAAPDEPGAYSKIPELVDYINSIIN
ncbi:transmembrane protease serine 9-like [Diorhabda carinulata]|uniref:transmembrane protease serine 9-like n=1 Tax=Diorhabda carinulata TaxID=1163345 RepID=UPI0025A0C6C5|nr:transmembrane protease serine 9-like [Diorhabda carinulata]